MSREEENFEEFATRKKEVIDSMGNAPGYTHKPVLVNSGNNKPFPMIASTNKFIDNLAERRKREDNNT
mgnify:FL=1